MVLVQKWPFFPFFFRQYTPRKFPVFFGNKGKENIFYDILARKTPSYSIKPRSSKRQIIYIFPKGLTHGFAPKMAVYLIFFLGNKGQENIFYDVLAQKKPCLRYKNRKFKQSKNWHFSKGVNTWFCSKNGHFFNFFFFGNIGQENIFLRYSSTKKRLFRL